MSGCGRLGCEPQPATRVSDEKEVMEVSPRLERVRVPDTYPRERVVLGELHLLRGRLDEMLGEVAGAIERSDHAEEGWLAVEEAARLARRALVAAASAVPPLSPAPQRPSVARRLHLV
jgi:hypothetical protein